jgi:hypothetical protein
MLMAGDTHKVGPKDLHQEAVFQGRKGRDLGLDRTRRVDAGHRTAEPGLLVPSGRSWWTKPAVDLGHRGVLTCD